jgi:fructose-1,6-bisphosphatase
MLMEYVSNMFIQHTEEKVSYETYEGFEFTAKLKNSFVHGTELRNVLILFQKSNLFLDFVGNLRNL